jgi:hypothetical protein
VSIVVEEMFRGRRGDAYSSRERDYRVIGDGIHADLEETDAIAAAVSASPASIASLDGTLVRTNAQLNRVVTNSILIVTVQYGETGYSGAATKPIGTVEYEFNYQAPSENIQYSLQTISITSVAGDENPNMFGGLIRPSRYSDDILGLDTTPGNTTNVWSFTFKTRPAGSMRLVSVSSQTTSGSKSMIRFGMQYSANATNLRVGEITVPFKDGHDYLWVDSDLKEVTLNGGKKRILPQPEFAVVERVFPRMNFYQLGF